MYGDMGKLLGVIGALAALSAVALWIGPLGQDPIARPEVSAAPMIAIEDAPESPPAVALVAAAEGELVEIQRGSIMNGFWPGAEQLATAAPDLVEWPDAASLSTDTGVGIRIPSRALPRTVTVSAYDAVGESDGIPRDLPKLRLECGLSMLIDPADQCSLDEDGGGWFLDLAGLEVVGDRWVAVNITWFGPPSDGDFVHLWATWLFVVSESWNS